MSFQNSLNTASLSFFDVCSLFRLFLVKSKLVLPKFGNNLVKVKPMPEIYPSKKLIDKTSGINATPKNYMQSYVCS